MSSMDEVILAINFIEANLTKKMDLDMISGAVHYSKYHLHRVFSDTVGLTIHDYIQRRQLTEAAKLLVFSGKPIVQIAFLSGYQSQQAFTNAFTAMYKMPPICTGKMNGFIPYSSNSILKGVMKCLTEKKRLYGRFRLRRMRIFPAGWNW